MHNSAVAKNAPFAQVSHHDTPRGVRAHKINVEMPSIAIGGPTTTEVHR